MKKEVLFHIASSDILDQYEQTYDVEVPGKCPHCNTGIIPIELGAYYHETMDDERLMISFLCPSCENFFVAFYNESNDYSSYLIYPAECKQIEIDDSVNCLSPSFCKIHSQATQAEELGLSEVAGLGYRKALEFLIKDYAISKDQANENQIKAEPLSQSIRRIEDPRIKTLAERSTWIGNDETHYVKKHENLDIADMKRFINSLLRFIESEIAFEEALSIEYTK